MHHSRSTLDAALLKAEIIPEHLKERDPFRTTGRGGVYGPYDGEYLIRCEVEVCQEGFDYRGTRKDLEEDLSQRGWSFHEHYVEHQARPVLRILYCPKHGGSSV